MTMTAEQVTAMRIQFEAQLDKWAIANGYTRKQSLWISNTDYLTIRRDSSRQPFVAEKRELKTGKYICDVEIT